MRAQMEIIGLAFIVVFLILAFFLYAILSANNPSTLPSQQIIAAETYAKSLQTAMLETHVPNCDSSLGRTIISCVQNPQLECGTQDICVAAYEAWDQMLTLTVGNEFTDTVINHHATILQPNREVLPVFGMGGDFVHAPFPDECSPATLGYAAPEQPLPTSSGTLLFVLKLCP